MLLFAVPPGIAVAVDPTPPAGFAAAEVAGLLRAPPPVAVLAGMVGVAVPRRWEVALLALVPRAVPRSAPGRRGGCRTEE